MTVYTGDINAALTFLTTTVAAVPNLAQTDVTTRATLRVAASSLSARLAEAITLLDGQITPGGLSGPDYALSGSFPINSVAGLTASISNCEQMARLLDMAGYAGRLSLNLSEVQ